MIYYIFYIIYYIWYIIYYILYMIYNIWYMIYYILYTIYYILYIIFYILYCSYYIILYYTQTQFTDTPHISYVRWTNRHYCIPNDWVFLRISKCLSPTKYHQTPYCWCPHVFSSNSPFFIDEILDKSSVPQPVSVDVPNLPGTKADEYAKDEPHGCSVNTNWPTSVVHCGSTGATRLPQYSWKWLKLVILPSFLRSLWKQSFMDVGSKSKWWKACWYSRS